MPTCVYTGNPWSMKVIAKKLLGRTKENKTVSYKTVAQYNIDVIIDVHIVLDVASLLFHK